ncbi:hypothetical protein Tco_0212270 [Tanacetum coccineum]
MVTTRRNSDDDVPNFEAMNMLRIVRTVELKGVKGALTGDLENGFIRPKCFAMGSTVYCLEEVLGHALERIIMDPSKVEAITNGRTYYGDEVISFSDLAGYTMFVEELKTEIVSAMILTSTSVPVFSDIQSDASKKGWCLCFDETWAGDRATLQTAEAYEENYPNPRSVN